jgi:alpha-beta hydrolase superfamily lysophospholipase
MLEEVYILCIRHRILIIVAIVSSILGYVYRLARNYTQRRIDEADERRRRHNKMYVPPLGIDYQFQWIPNREGLLLFKQQYFPARNTKVKGIVGLVHGFGDHSNNFLVELAEKLCRSGYVVLSMDAIGHGLSDGLHGHIEDIQDIARDFSDYFKEYTQSTKTLAKLPFFVYGVSMGGAVVFNLCTKHDIRHRIKGAILSAPMVTVAPEMKPPEFIIGVLRKLAKILPYAPVAPIPDILGN